MNSAFKSKQFYNGCYGWCLARGGLELRRWPDPKYDPVRFFSRIPPLPSLTVMKGWLLVRPGNLNLEISFTSQMVVTLGWHFIICLCCQKCHNDGRLGQYPWYATVGRPLHPRCFASLSLDFLTGLLFLFLFLYLIIDHIQYLSV